MEIKEDCCKDQHSLRSYSFNYLTPFIRLSINVLRWTCMESRTVILSALMCWLRPSLESTLNVYISEDLGLLVLFCLFIHTLCKPRVVLVYMCLSATLNDEDCFPQLILTFVVHCNTDMEFIGGFEYL